MSQDFGPYFRLIVCLLLVFCLLVSISPIRSQAAAVATFNEVAIESVIGIGAIVSGLGVSRDPTKQAVFDTLVNNIVSHFNFSTTMQVVGWVANGCQRYAVPQSLIEDVRSYLWSNKTVYEQSSGDCFIPSGTQLGSYTVVGDCYGFKHGYFSSYSVVLCSFSKFYLVSSDGSTLEPMYRGTHYDLSNNTLPSYGFPSVSDSLYDYQAAKKFLNGGYDFKPESKIVVSSGLIAGNIADESTSFAAGYATWAAGTVAVPGSVVGSDSDDEIAYVPLSIGQTYTETVSQTQEEVQTGDASYVDTSENATTGLLGTVIGWLEDIWTAIKSIPSAFSQWFTNIITWLHDIWDVISTLPKSIADAIAEVLTAIFVPTEDYLTEKVEAIRSEFAFADAIITTGEFFKTRFAGLGTEPPVIYINLGAAEGSYNLGGTIPFLDLSWYERYKPTGDVLISSFLWIVFAWRMLLKVPGIISGMPGDFVMQGMQEIGIADHLPSRKKEYEIQRQDNRNVIRRHKE